jgi:hypothetical protein
MIEIAKNAHLLYMEHVLNASQDMLFQQIILVDVISRIAYYATMKYAMSVKKVIL